LLIPLKPNVGSELEYEFCRNVSTIDCVISLPRPLGETLFAILSASTQGINLSLSRSEERSSFFFPAPESRSLYCSRKDPVVESEW
jgi:hypothetical protein